ncbi:hypothetical protein BGX28_001570 [Mortierella sp. GBA30]|nr:hypothetical protein BGX28_001570 [Mortierella sp. GBA30]
MSTPKSPKSRPLSKVSENTTNDKEQVRQLSTAKIVKQVTEHALLPTAINKGDDEMDDVTKKEEEEEDREDMEEEYIEGEGEGEGEDEEEDEELSERERHMTQVILDILNKSMEEKQELERKLQEERMKASRAKSRALEKQAQYHQQEISLASRQMGVMLYKQSLKVEKTMLELEESQFMRRKEDLVKEMEKFKREKDEFKKEKDEFEKRVRKRQLLEIELAEEEEDGKPKRTLESEIKRPRLQNSVDGAASVQAAVMTEKKDRRVKDEKRRVTKTTKEEEDRKTQGMISECVQKMEDMLQLGDIGVDNSAMADLLERTSDKGYSPEEVAKLLKQLCRV